MCQRAFRKEGDQDDKLGSPRWVPEGGRRGIDREDFQGSGDIARRSRRHGGGLGVGERWGGGHYGPAQRKQQVW